MNHIRSLIICLLYFIYAISFFSFTGCNTEKVEEVEIEHTTETNEKKEETQEEEIKHATSDHCFDICFASQNCRMRDSDAYKIYACKETCEKDCKDHIFDNEGFLYAKEVSIQATCLHRFISNSIFTVVGKGKFWDEARIDLERQCQRADKKFIKPESEQARVIY